MTLKEAIKIFEDKFKNYRLISYRDLGDMYVIEAVPKMFDEISGDKIAMDPWYFVNKQTKETNHYYPFNFDATKFFSTKPVEF